MVLPAFNHLIQQIFSPERPKTYSIVVKAGTATRPLLPLGNVLILLVVRFTNKKENQIFLLYKEIQSDAVAKSYTRKGFLIHEEMRKYFPIYEGH
jgi:hypothetical protein